MPGADTKILGANHPTHHTHQPIHPPKKFKPSLGLDLIDSQSSFALIITSPWSVSGQMISSGMRWCYLLAMLCLAAHSMPHWPWLCAFRALITGTGSLGLTQNVGSSSPTTNHQQIWWAANIEIIDECWGFTDQIKKTSKIALLLVWSCFAEDELSVSLADRSSSW